MSDVSYPTKFLEVLSEERFRDKRFKSRQRMILTGDRVTIMVQSKVGQLSAPKITLDFRDSPMDYFRGFEVVDESTLNNRVLWPLFRQT